MIRKLSTVIFAIITALAAWLAWPALSLAQGPEIVPCVAPQYDQPSSSVTLASEDVIPANGWSCNNCTFDVDSAVFGSPITGGSSYFTRTLALPAYHGAVQISITANTNSGRTGNVLARLGDAQEGFFATYDSTTRTFTKTLAQGTSHANALTLYGQSNGSLRLLDISISPVSDLSRNSLSFIDPDLNGIDYGSWYEVVTTTGVFSTGSRAVGGVLTIDHQDYDYRCTSLLLTANYSDSLIVNFDGGATGNSAVVVAGTVVPDLDDLDDALYGPSVSILNPGPLPYTMTAGISFTATGVTPAYLCIKPINHTGSTGDPYMDNFSASVCVEPVCTTVDNFSFTFDTGWEKYNGAYIANNTAIMTKTVVNPGLIAQELTAIPLSYEVYTVTISARVTGGDGNAKLIAGLSANQEDIDDYALDRYQAYNFSYQPERIEDFEIISGSFQTITHTFEAGENLPLLGMQKWLFLTTDDGGTFEGETVEVDWVCIEPGGGVLVCTDPYTQTFTLNDGQNYGSIFDPPRYGSAQGWTGIDYRTILSSTELLNPTPLDASQSIIPTWRAFDAGNIDYAVGLYAISGLLGFLEPPYTAIEYESPVIPQRITTRIVYPTGADPVAILFTDDGDGWAYNTHQALGDGSSIDLAHSITTDVITPAGNITQPVNIALAITLESPNGELLQAEKIGFENIELYGCYPGDPLTGECVVLDPELDSYNGGPHPFYWLGNYTARDGYADLIPGNIIYQNVTPPNAGTFQLTMVGSGFLNGDTDCNFSIETRELGGTTVLNAQDVACKLGLVQTYTLSLDLPTDPVEIALRQNIGRFYLDYFCLTRPDEPRCLNINPIFFDGNIGYTGDFTIANGQAVVEPGKSLAAVGVLYGLNPMTQTFQLEIIGAPVATSSVDVRIVDNLTPPTPGHPSNVITSTTTITHVVGADLVQTHLGPAVWNWNNPFESALAISQYCITALTDTTTWFNGKLCQTLTNADFVMGLDSWEFDQVSELAGWAVFGSSGYVSQTTILPITSTITATLHWIGSAPGLVGSEGTAVISSDAGVFTVTRSFVGSGLAGEEYFDHIAVGPTVTVQINGDAGLELDYACLVPGEYTAPPPPPGADDPPGGGIGDVSANCAPPPMVVMSDTLDAWLPSIWFWESPQPNNIEIVATYSAAWLRYIGCFLTGLGKMLEAKLNEIIFLLRLLTVLQALDTLASILQVLVDAIEILEETIDDLIDTIAGPVASLLYILGVIAGFLLALAGLVLLVAAVIYLVWLIPQDFWSSFTDVLGSADAIIMPMPTDESHPLYAMLYGMQVINQSVGETVIFPIVIIAIAASSFQIMLWTINRIRGLE
jgi:hypothetical protein